MRNVFTFWKVLYQIMLSRYLFGFYVHNSDKFCVIVKVSAFSFFPMQVFVFSFPFSTFVIEQNKLIYQIKFYLVYLLIFQEGLTLIKINFVIVIIFLKVWFSVYDFENSWIFCTLENWTITFLTWNLIITPNTFYPMQGKIGTIIQRESFMLCKFWYI